MEKITKNKRYEYGKLKTGATHLNKWPNWRKKHSRKITVFQFVIFSHLAIYLDIWDLF